MTHEPDTTFRRGVVRPIECYKQGWELIKGNYWLFLGIALVATLIGGAVPFYILLGPCLCGVYLCYFRQMEGRTPPFELLFKGFDHFVQSLIATLIWAVPFFVVIAASYMAFFVGLFVAMPAPQPGVQPDAGPIWGMMLGLWGFMLFVMLIMMAVQMLVMFAYPLIAERGLTGPQALQVSCRAVLANLPGMVGLYLIHLGLNVLGSFACCIGQFFILPINFASMAVAYRTVFPKPGAGTGGSGIDDDATEPSA